MFFVSRAMPFLAKVEICPDGRLQFVDSWTVLRFQRVAEDPDLVPTFAPHGLATSGPWTISYLGPLSETEGIAKLTLQAALMNELPPTDPLYLAFLDRSDYVLRMVIKNAPPCAPLVHVTSPLRVQLDFVDVG
jgi:hypothetical protein